MAFVGYVNMSRTISYVSRIRILLNNEDDLWRDQRHIIYERVFVDVSFNRWTTKKLRSGCKLIFAWLMLCNF